MDDDEAFRGINGDELAPAEVKSIQALARLSKRWPKTVKLVSMGGSLYAVHADDERFHHEDGVIRQESVLYAFDGIPNDGGDW